MSEMVERVARAIWEKRREMARKITIELEEWGDGSIPRSNHVFEEARAAIEAMREPTETMLITGVACMVIFHDYPESDMSFQKLWKITIDEALK